MADRERSRSPDRDEGAAPAPAADTYEAPADNDTNGGGAAANGGATEEGVKLYVGNLDYGKSRIRFRQ